MRSGDRAFTSAHPLVRHKLTLLRDTGTGPKRFRELLREISVLLAYEATRDLATVETSVTTPLATTAGHILTEAISLVPILRAGLGMVEPILELMPAAEVWHVGLYRDHKTLQPVQYYQKLPVSSAVKVCLVLDPMLATGGSAVATVDLLKDLGVRRIKFVGIVGAPEGVQALSAAHPDVDIHLAAIDDYLTPAPASPGDPPEGYIVPGLGDAGDRQFGTV